MPDSSGREMSNEAQNSSFKWYVVHTLSGHENKAKLLLEERIKNGKMEIHFGRILVPTENVAEVVAGKKRTSKRKFFPGYILVEMEMTQDSWHLVKDTDKITGFVGDSQKPRAMKPSEVNRILGQIEVGEKDVKPVSSFDAGQTVRVVEGPFINFSGIIDEVKAEKRKLRVMVTIFGRSTPVEVDFMQVEKV